MGNFKWPKLLTLLNPPTRPPLVLVHVGPAPSRLPTTTVLDQQSSLDVDVPLTSDQILPVVKRILKEGRTGFAKKARLQLAEHDMTTPDAINVLRYENAVASIENPATTESIVYTIQTERMGVAVTLLGEMEIEIVRVWRK